MTDYISRQAAIKAIVDLTVHDRDGVRERGEDDPEEWIGGINDAITAVEELPPIDAVPVVRCKDCKYNALHPNAGNTLCKQGVTLYQRVDFCSLGERREND